MEEWGEEGASRKRHKPHTHKSLVGNGFLRSSEGCVCVFLFSASVDGLMTTCVVYQSSRIEMLA